MENVLVLDQKKYKIEIVDKAQTRADISFNIILLGDSGVGKSCFSIRAIKDEFIEQIEGTYFISYDIKINNRSMCIQDVCGEDIYKSLVSNYYKNISIAILMYAINDRESFDNIKSWLDDVKHQSRNDVMIILVGNKTDLEKDRKITNKEGADLAKKNNYYFKETSCETNTNVADVFETIILMTHKDMVKSGKFNYNEKENMETFKLTAEKNVLNDKTKQKKKCC